MRTRPIRIPITRSLSRFLAFTALAPLIALAALSASAAWSYEIQTHRAVSNVAIHRADCIADDYLKQQLLLAGGITTLASGGSLASRVEDGAENEDTDTHTRPKNHFYCPITKLGLNDFFQGKSSLLWAYDDPENQYSWRAARDAFYASLTLDTKADRMLELGEVFYDLGHVIHLVQDLGQPQHTRNDAHVTHFFGTSFPGGPYETYCDDHYGTPGSIANLGSLPAPSFVGYSFSPYNNEIPPAFSSFWDTGQLVAAPFAGSFTVFFNTPGLSEFSNAYFITDDTMFGNFHVGLMRRPGGHLLRVRLLNGVDNVSASDRTHSFMHPSLFDTDLASFYPASTAAITLERFGQGLTQSVHHVSLTMHDATGAVVYSMPNLFNINDRNEIGFDDGNYETWAQVLLPRTAAYSVGMLNYFFRGKIDVIAGWLKSSQEYELTITNRSGEPLSFGNWHLFQDDDAGVRTEIPATFHFPGNVADGESFTCDFTPTSRTGPYTIVYRGSLGQEGDIAVVGKTFDIVRVAITWGPNSDQELMLWAQDNHTLVSLFHPADAYGVLSSGDAGYHGPASITTTLPAPGRYAIVVDYYRDWVKEKEFDQSTQACTPTFPGFDFAADDPDDPCFVPTTVTINVDTFHNSSDAVRSETRTLTLPDLFQTMIAPGEFEGPINDSEFLTQVINVDADHNVFVVGTSPQSAPHTPAQPVAAAPPRAAHATQRAAPAPARAIATPPPAQREGRTP